MTCLILCQAKITWQKGDKLLISNCNYRRKKRMKKFLKLLVLICILSLVTIVPSACSLKGIIPSNNSTTTNVSKHTVTFDTCGGSSVSSKRVADGGTMRAPSSKRSGYHLVGWYRDPEYTMEFDFNSSINEDLTLYAKWEENDAQEKNPEDGTTDEPSTDTSVVSGYMVTFNCKGGSYRGFEQYLVTSIASGKKVSKITPTRSGYDFAGWYTDEACTTAYDFNSAVNSSFTLYAKWTEKTYVVKYDCQGGKIGEESTVTVSVNNNAKVENKTPTKDGYIFLGWYTNLNGTVFDFNTPITSDVTLKAKWIPKQYTYHNIIYKLSDDRNSLSVVGFKESTTLKTVDLPSYIPASDSPYDKDLPVTAIAANAFESCKNIESISIHTAVSSIGSLAFNNCSKLIIIFCYGYKEKPETFASDWLGNCSATVSWCG